MNELIIDQMIKFINSSGTNINNFVDNHQILVSGFIAGSFAILGTLVGNRLTLERERRQWAKEKIYTTYVSVVNFYSDLIGLTYSSDHHSLKESDINFSNLIGSLSSLLIISKYKNQEKVRKVLKNTLSIKENGLSIRKDRIAVLEHDRNEIIEIMKNDSRLKDLFEI